MSQIDKQAEIITAGILDFPRKKLPDQIWDQGEDLPLPELKPQLRSLILSEARKRLGYVGAQLIGANLYGGAAGYQYHKGGDIDVSLYIDWDKFKGSFEALESLFKDFELPWGDYVIHLFIKPKTQPEQVEVADAYYDVLKNEWKLPPLVLPKNFDPEVFFKRFIELAEVKAQKLDYLMGKVQREWSKLKNAVRSREEGPRDLDIVNQRIELQKVILLDLIDELVSEFAEVWVGRRKMHDELRVKYVQNRDVGRYERFQLPEIVWKYLDQAGYVEFLKLLSKAYSEGTIKKLIDAL